MESIKSLFTINKKALFILIVILILGSGLRFYGLELNSLWNDEIGSWRQANYDTLSDVIEKGVRPDVYPPLYATLMFFVQKNVGDTEYELRFPSAVAGVLSLLVIFLVGQRLYSYKEGLIAAAVMAVMWVPVYYSQEARAYAMLVFFLLLAVYFGILLVERLNRGEKIPILLAAAYIISAAATAYLHYYGLYFIFLQGLGAILFYIRRRKQLFTVLIILLPVVLLYVPWMPILWEQYTNAGGAYDSRASLSWPFIKYLSWCFNKSRALEAIAALLTAIPFFIYLRGLWQNKQHKNPRSYLLAPAFWLVLWLSAPFIGAYIKSLFSASLVSGKAFRYLIISTPAAYLLLARGIARLPIRPLLQGIVALALVGLFLWHLVFYKDYYTVPTKEQFREAAQFVMDRDNKYPNALIVANYVKFNYYFKKNNFSKAVGELVARPWELEESTFEQSIKDANPQYIWYMTGHKDPNQEIIDYFKAKFTLLDHQKYFKAEVWLFENKLYEPGRAGKTPILPDYGTYNYLDPKGWGGGGVSGSGGGGG